MKLVHHHTPSRSRDESNHVALPHGRLRVGCLQGIFPSFKTNHIPLMNGLRRRRRKTLHTGSGESPTGAGTGGDSSRTPSRLLCEAWG